MAFHIALPAKIITVLHAFEKRIGGKSRPVFKLTIDGYSIKIEKLSGHLTWKVYVAPGAKIS